MSKLSVSLVDCRCFDSERDALVRRYKDSLISQAGSVEAVIAIYEASERVMEAHGGWPTDEATPEEESAVDRWMDMDWEATRVAFAEWMSVPDAAHFEVEVRS